MHEIEMKVKPLEELKEKLVECSKAELLRGDISSVDTQEMGEAIDMVKDLSEAVKCCWEAKYFETVVKAMEGEDARYGYTVNGGSPINPYPGMGYNSNRSARTGRYTSGFRPMPAPMGDMMPSQMLDMGSREMYGVGDSEWDEMTSSMPWRETMGYGGSNGGRGGSSGNSGGSTGSGNGNAGYGRGMGYMIGPEEEWNPRYGEAYNKFKNSRKHYQSTKDLNDKKEMNTHMTEHVMDTIATVREMWQDADPELRKKMKADFETLVKEMQV